MISGTKISEQLTPLLYAFTQNMSVKPVLHVFLIGNNHASASYVQIKQKKAMQIGIDCNIIHLPETIREEELLKMIAAAGSNKEVHGIIVQMPLPDHINSINTINAIPFYKDVDGFTRQNAGAIFAGIKPFILFDQFMKIDTQQKSQNIYEESISNFINKKYVEKLLSYISSSKSSIIFAPCTAIGIIHLIKSTLGYDIAGKNALVIGRSNIVGRPTAALLTSENCTVTLAHSATQNLDDICKRSDIIVVAVGRERFVDGSWIPNNACVIDVGINKNSLFDKEYNINLNNQNSYDERVSRICGDVDYQNALQKTQYITPVPGGVGPMTVLYLMHNTILSAIISQNI